MGTTYCCTQATTNATNDLNQATSAEGDYSQRTGSKVSDYHN